MQVLFENKMCYTLFFETYSQPKPSFIIYLYSIHRAICRPLDHALCGEAPGRDSNPGRADLVAGTLTTRPPHLTIHYSMTVVTC